jgi:hypothetical protein
LWDVVFPKGNHQMTIKEDDSRKLRTLVANAPTVLPHYCDDLKTQRRVGKVIGAHRQPSDFRVRTVWL